MEKWSGKIAVVTGASAGIGEAIVKDLAKHGIHVIGLARRSEKVDLMAKSFLDFPGRIYARKCDVSDLKSIEDAFKWIEEKFGFMHILINNAAIVSNLKILDEGEDVSARLNAVVDTNFTGLVHVTRAAFQLIKKSDDYGMIVNINSILGHLIPFAPEPRTNLYSPTKHAVTAVTEVLRQELIAQNNEKIRVSNLSPGTVKTDIIVSGGYVKTKEEYFDASPHLLTENVSQSILFLLQTPYNVNITELVIKPVGERV